mgnify:CR=1 FL=1
MTNIAIIGATGNVGRKTLEVIEKKDIKFDNLFLVASSNSAGKKISFKGKDYEVHDLEKYDITLNEIYSKLSSWIKQKPGGLF